MTASFHDVQLLQREFYNPQTYTVKFTRMKEHDTYVLLAGKKLGPEIVLLGPQEHAYLPHGYFLIEGIGLPPGEPVEILMNLEKNMFKGIKVPSNVYGLDE